MAEESNTDAIVGVTATNGQTEKTAVKKQRAPRRTKAAAEPATVASEETTSKPAKVTRRKRGEKAASTTAEPAKTRGRPATRTTTAKPAGRGKAAAPVSRKPKASNTAIDEIADLIQLEDENKKLRKTLADKLRKENADLRKRLGIK